MTILSLPQDLGNTDPQMMLSQIVYHFTHASVDKDPDERFSCLFLPSMNYLFAGFMQAMGYNMLSPKTRRVIVVCQGEQEDDFIVSGHDAIDVFLGKQFAFDTELTQFFAGTLLVRKDSEAIYTCEAFWNQLPFLRVGFPVDTVYPLIMPQNSLQKQQLTALLVQLLTQHDDLSVVFSGQLSIAHNKQEVRTMDTKHLTSSLLGQNVELSGVQLFDVFVSVSRTLNATLSHMYYDDTQSIGYEKDDARGLLVSGF